MKKHTKACQKRTAQYREQLAAFEKEYPNYCKDCGGTGAVTYTENFAPYGSNQSWLQEMTDACQECSAELICPLCGKAEALTEDTEFEECLYCDYLWGGDVIAPQEPYCDCWMVYERL